MHTGRTIRAASAQRLGMRTSGFESTCESHLGAIKGALNLDAMKAIRVLVTSRNLD